VPSGYSVTVASPSTWDAMTTAQFASYSAIIIGDPSSGGTCASSVPADALSTASTWGPAVTGNVAVLGTAPALAGGQGTSLITDAIGYAVAGGGTGLYVSLNCEYSTASARTAVPLLASVEGGGFTVRGHRASCPNSGTVNTWAAENSSQFNGLASAALASWTSPACSVQETFDAWPAGFSAVAYDAGVTPTEFTASDGATGQAYVLLGAPVTAATAQLAPTVGGELLAGATAGGSNSAAPGASATVTPVANGVNAANGDFTQSGAGFSIPAFGPPLDFTRTYDAQVARQQTVAGTPVAAAAPGSMGYGWSDNWDSWLSVGSPVPDDIYRIAGTGVSGTTGTAGNGGPALHAQLQNPFGMTADPQGDLLIADTFNNRVQEVAAYSHTQFGIAMTAGDVYTVAGSATGAAGHSGDGGAATSALLSGPYGVAVDAAGNLYIADAGNNRIQEVPAATGSQWGQSMTASDMYTVAGSASGTPGHSGDGGVASSALLDSPQDVIADGQGNLYIADTFNARVQEVAAATGSQWGQSMTGSDIYTVAGSATGATGNSGNGGPATSALLTSPAGVAIDPAGDLYIADNQANQVREIAVTTNTQWGQSMTANDIYTVAGSSAGTPGSAGDGTLATAALLHGPWAVAVDASGNLYVADTGNARVQEVPAADGTQWGQSMTAAYTYTVAGTGVSGNSGNAGPATSAKLSAPQALGVDPAGDLFIPDQANNMIREVFATTGPTFPVAPAASGVTVTQGNGSQVTFYPKSGGACTSPYVPAGGYCALPQNVAATLTYSSGSNTYTYTPAPGLSYTYAATGSLTAETDATGNTLTVGYHTPAPGVGNCPATANWCQTITAASGRALTVGYNASNEVTSVTDPMARRWTYAYSSGDLTSATDPMGNVTSYTYGAGNTGNPQLANDLLTITRPNAQPGGPDAGDATVNVYNASGQIKSQTDPLGYKTTLDYTGLNTSTGTGVVRVSDPDGNTNVYAYAQGALTAQSAWTGTTTLTSETDYGPNLTAIGTSGGTLLDTWKADGNGLITTYTFDSGGNIISATDPLGNQTTKWSTALDRPSCDGLPTATSPCSSAQTGPAPVTPGGTITPPSSAPPYGVTYYQYDTNGNVLWTTTGVYRTVSGGASAQRTDYNLYTGNNVTLNGNTINCGAAPPSPSLPCATVAPNGMVTQFTYNAQGDLTSMSWPDGNGSETAKTTYAYDADGEQTSTTSADGNLPGANAGNYTTVTGYNADGMETSVTKAGGSGATATPRTTSYGYDANNNPTKVTDPRGYPTTTTYDADNTATLVTDPLGNATLTCYDGDGNAIETVPPAGVAASSLTPASCPTTFPAGYGTRLASDATTATYDASRDPTAATLPAPAGQTGHESVTNTYDGAGQLVKTDGPPAGGGQNAPDQVTYDTYSADGLLTSQTTGYGTPAAATTSYTYDPNGNRTAVVPPMGGQPKPATPTTPWAM
jgi:YD repeat-containing protein